MKTELINKDGSKTPPRPTWYADKKGIATNAMEKMFSGKYCEFNESEKECLIESIVDNWSEHVDTYDLAKGFEDDGWDVDSNFLDRLESVDSCVSGEIRRRVKQWGADNNIVQPLPLGAELDCGAIDGIYEYDPATYCVKMWEKQDNPTTRRLIKWENAALKVGHS